MRTPGWVSASLLGLLAAALISSPAANAQTPPPQSEQPSGTSAEAPVSPPAENAPVAQPPVVPEAQTPKPSAQPGTGGESKPERAAEPQPPQVTQPATSPPAPKEEAALRIATSGGAYLKAQERALFEPFTKRQGRQIKATAYDGGYDALKAHGSEWDLVDLDGGTAARACNDKLLEPLDASALESAPGGATAAEDFLPGAIQPCAIASVAWSAVVVYDKGAKKEPTKLADFFDTRKFPGKRLLPKGPKFTLELALLADGVAPGDVYTTLATPEGQTRALAKLNSIKDSIIWFEKPEEMFSLIAQKGNVMGLAFNGRAFMAIVNDRQPLAILWDHQIYAFDYWAIPSGAKNAATAKEFIRFATSPGPLSDQARYLPYGPARRSAARLPVKHSELDMEMKSWLPTHEPNLQGALAFDPGWWGGNETSMKERFTAWLEGREASAGAPSAPPQ